MNTKEFRATLAIAVLVWNFIRTATREDIIHAVIVTAVFLVVMLVLYWYNNSHTEPYKFGDYVAKTVQTMLDEGNLTKVDKIKAVLEENDDDKCD